MRGVKTTRNTVRGLAATCAVNPAVFCRSAQAEAAVRLDNQRSYIAQRCYRRAFRGGPVIGCRSKVTI